jgi:hypothetical protein
MYPIVGVLYGLIVPAVSICLVILTIATCFLIILTRSYHSCMVLCSRVPAGPPMIQVFDFFGPAGTVERAFSDRSIE